MDDVSGSFTNPLPDGVGAEDPRVIILHAAQFANADGSFAGVGDESRGGPQGYSGAYLRATIFADDLDCDGIPGYGIIYGAPDVKGSDLAIEEDEQDVLYTIVSCEEQENPDGLDRVERRLEVAKYIYKHPKMFNYFLPLRYRVDLSKDEELDLAAICFINALLFTFRYPNGKFYKVDMMRVADVINAEARASTIAESNKVLMDQVDVEEFSKILEAVASSMPMWKEGEITPAMLAARAIMIWREQLKATGYKFYGPAVFVENSIVDLSGGGGGAKTQVVTKDNASGGFLQDNLDMSDDESTVDVADEGDDEGSSVVDVSEAIDGAKVEDYILVEAALPTLSFVAARGIFNVLSYAISQVPLVEWEGAANLAGAATQADRSRVIRTLKTKLTKWLTIIIGNREGVIQKVSLDDDALEPFSRMEDKYLLSKVARALKRVAPMESDGEIEDYGRAIFSEKRLFGGVIARLRQSEAFNSVIEDDLLSLFELPERIYSGDEPLSDPTLFGNEIANWYVAELFILQWTIALKFAPVDERARINGSNMTEAMRRLANGLNTRESQVSTALINLSTGAREIHEVSINTTLRKWADVRAAKFPFTSVVLRICDGLCPAEAKPAGFLPRIINEILTNPSKAFGLSEPRTFEDRLRIL